MFRLGALPLETLKGIDYTKSLNEKEADEIDYSALQKFINACRAYSTGIAVLPNLHAPVLTRGDSGISVFRKVSPSVVLVLRQI